MSIAINVANDSNHTAVCSKPILARQSELGEVLSVTMASGLRAVFPKAYIFYTQANGQSYIISDGGSGFTYAVAETFSYVLGSADTMMTYDGQIKLQIVLCDVDIPNQTKVWRSKVITLTVDSSIITADDSIAGIADIYESFMLSQISDVTLTSPSNGDVLTYEVATQTWKNLPSTSGTQLSGLLDVDVSTKTNGDYLVYNSITGKWEDEALDLSAYAPLASPTFTGTPSLPTGTTAVTQASSVKNTTLATTDYANSLLAEYEVAGSAVTSIDFSGLDINTHKSYVVEIELKNATASNSNVSLFINGDTTATNYYTQVFGYSHTTAVAGRSNNAIVCGLKNSTSSVVFAKFNIMLSDGGIANSLSHDREGVSTATPESYVYALTKAATVANITQLTFTASVANSIAVGSRIRLYRGDV